eukprot:10751931-Ditylum_brightwellii.AAC.1
MEKQVPHIVKEVLVQFSGSSIYILDDDAQGMDGTIEDDGGFSLEYTSKEEMTTISAMGIELRQ